MQQQSNETDNYEMSIKLHTYETHTNTTLLLNFITDQYYFLTNADNQCWVKYFLKVF